MVHTGTPPGSVNGQVPTPPMHNSPLQSGLSPMPAAPQAFPASQPYPRSTVAGNVPYAAGSATQANAQVSMPTAYNDIGSHQQHDTGNRD